MQLNIKLRIPSFVRFSLVNVQSIIISYYFCQVQVISVTIVGFSFFSGRVPTVLSTCVSVCVCVCVCVCIYIYILQTNKP